MLSLQLPGFTLGAVTFLSAVAGHLTPAILIKCFTDKVSEVERVGLGVWVSGQSATI